MHRCLLIQEVLRIICTHVGTSCPRPRRDLLAMALTCRHFFDVSMDQLWHEVPNLHPVLTCLPSDVWRTPLATIVGFVIITRPVRAITPADLERFKIYAHRVRVFQDRALGILDDVYQALDFAFQGQPTFPNLIELNQTLSLEGVPSPNITMLLGPRIRRISLGLEASDPDQTSLLPLLGKKYPALVQFILQANYNPDIGCQINRALSGWDQLQTLTVPHLSEESFRIVAGLPHLLSLVLNRANSRFGDTFSPISGQPVFPVLRKLSVRANTLALCANLLRAATNCPLEDFTFYPTEASAPLDWHDLFSALAESCNKATLTSIRAGDTGIPDEQVEALLAGTTDQLRPLLLFTNLTHVNLGTCYGFNVDDAFIREMATAWPHLRCLDIGTTEMCRPIEQQPQLTLQGLAPLARFCPDLEDLSVYIDATHLCSNHIDLGSSPSDSQVKSLEVYRSPISQSSVPWAASFLSAIFPRLRYVDCDDQLRDGEERVAYPGRWLEVTNHLAAYRHARGHQQDNACKTCN
ncbi:hypothetical protein BD779DRAFT_530230 [Infundibulicybe gibba]|nr:hypothetical protein BD779DRAFT_530230 [Infundibulicybe gibba]